MGETSTVADGTGLEVCVGLLRDAPQVTRDHSNHEQR